MYECVDDVKDADATPADAATRPSDETAGPAGEVEVLSFMRFDRFREILLESEDTELRAARVALEEAGFTADLGSYGLGPGILLVRSDLAKRVLGALCWRNFSNGTFLRNTDVVVTPELKPVVLAAVRRSAPRFNPLKRIEELILT